MEENMLKNFLEGYINIHNELVDLDISDKSKEIKKLNDIIANNDSLVKSYVDRAIVPSDEKEKRKAFEEGTKQYMEKIKESEKEIEEIQRQQEENRKRKEILENAQKNIREKARQFKDEKLAEEEKNRANDVLPKMYDYHLKKETEVRKKLEKFKDIELETTEQEVERIQLEKELRDIEKDKKTVAQQMNQKSNATKKIEKDYILFLGQLSLVDKNDKKILNQEEKSKVEPATEKQEEEPKINLANEKKEETIKDKIERVEQEFAKDMKDYSKIHLEADKEVNRVDLKIQPKMNSANEKSEQSIEETIKRIEQEFAKANKDYSKVHLKIEPEVDKDDIENKERVTYIEISEEDGKISWITNQEGNDERGIPEAFETKKAKFKKLDIYEKCEKISGGAITGWLLKRKLNPEIVVALEKYDDQLQEYISSIHNNTKLPFELVHKFGKVDLKTKILRNKFAKIERKLGATVLGKLFDKNEALNEAPQQNENTAKPIDEYRDVIDTKTQAKNTQEILKEQEEKRAKEVQKISKDNIEKVSGDAILNEKDEVVAELLGNGEER